MDYEIALLTGLMLDLAVAQCQKARYAVLREIDGELVVIDGHSGQLLNYSSSDELARPLLDSFEIELFKGLADQWRCYDFAYGNVYAGHTRREAGLRCYVSSSLRAEVIRLPAQTIGFRAGYRARDPLVPGSDHVENWIDRLGNAEFISDVLGGSTLQPTIFRAAVRDHDINHGLTEAAVWWM